jgi:hypothetical protein
MFMAAIAKILFDRKVRIVNAVSRDIRVISGVPQGSRLAPFVSSDFSTEYR